MAELGHYEIRGWGAKRRLPSFDDLVLLTASASRYPLEGYRERCDTSTVLGTRYASKPLHLEIPITIAGMSFGALSAHAKEALGRAASELGTSTTTGDGGMTPKSGRTASKTLVYQCLPSRYGFNPEHLRQADAIEVVIGQGAKPGGGGMLLGQKVSERVAAMRTLPSGVDQRSASRHPDWTGPDDLRIKIEELREATSWEKPVYVKLGATRVANDVKLAVAAGADVVVVDGMQGRYRRHADHFHRACWHPDIASRTSRRRGAPRDREATRSAAHRFWWDPLGCRCSQGPRARRDGSLDRRGRHGRPRLQPVLLTVETAQTTTPRPGTRALGTAPGFCHHCHTGLLPRRRYDSGPRPRVAARPSGRGALGGQLPKGDDDGAHGPGPGVREVQRPQPGAGGPGRPHGRGRGHGESASGGHQLDPRGAAGVTGWLDGAREEAGCRTCLTSSGRKRSRTTSSSFSPCSSTCTASPAPSSCPLRHSTSCYREGPGLPVLPPGTMGQSPADPDLVAVPDPASYTLAPWQPGLAVLQCDVHVEGAPWPYSPRLILQQVLELAKSPRLRLPGGVRGRVLPRPAFSRRPAGGGRPDDRLESPCYDAKALTRMYDHVTTVSKYMNRLGWANYANDHEDANGQFEQNFRHADALTTADRVVFFRYMVHTLAQQAGMTATFMPKPFTHLTGNGLHLHSSLWDDADGRGAVRLTPLTPGASGCQKRPTISSAGSSSHASALAAITCPSVNSYKRMGVGAPLSGATWAPAYVTLWGQ